MTIYYLILCVHVLGACFWVGGHLVLAATVLPRALREKRAAIITDFENGYERVGRPALVVQVLSGLWLAQRLLGAPGQWFEPSPLAQIVQLKLLLLAGTVALAVHAKTRVLPRLRDDNLGSLAIHVVAVTTLSVIFTLAGASLRLGGLPLITS